MKINKSFSAKAVILFLAVALIFGCAVGGTLAWLSAKTAPVTNTFTAGKINIALAETKTDFKMIPGTTIEKDPKVSVTANSEACWLFVKVTEEGITDSVKLTANATANTYITYDLAEGWTALSGESGVYYREVDATTAASGVSYSVLSGDKVQVPNTVTKAMLDTVTDTNAPKLTFTAYAVQKQGFATAAAAWEEAEKLG